MLMPFSDKLLLRKRAIVKTIIDQLKNISQIEHSRHRSVTNFLVNVLGGLKSGKIQVKYNNRSTQKIMKNWQILPGHKATNRMDCSPAFPLHGDQ